MLQAATPAHSALIRRLLREGAAGGSFEAAIADDSPEASLFFANLEAALGSGYLLAPGPDGRLSREVHVAGYVYSPAAGEAAVGFGLFKDAGPSDVELWLLGIAPEARRQGHGRAMLRELLATPTGQLASLVRTRTGAHGEVAAKLFREFGFELERTTPSMLWLVNAKASPELRQRIAALAPA